MEALYPCLEDTADIRRDNCAVLDAVVQRLVEEDLFGTAVVGTGFALLLGSRQLDSKVWQVRDVAWTLTWKPCE